MMVDKPEPYWLNQGQMAKAHGVSRESFYKWGVESVAKIGTTVYYLAGDVTANRVAQATAYAEKRLNEAKDQKLDAQKEQARERKERADNLALKNAQLRRELCPVDFVTQALATVGGQVTSALQTIPAEVRKKIPRLTAAEVAIIERIVIRAQNSAARLPVRVDEMMDDFARTESRV